MKVLYVHADREHEMNSAVWRCVKPAEALRKYGHTADVVFWNDMNVQDAIGQGYDVVVFQRYCWTRAHSDMKAFKKAGIKVVYDFDDDYLEMNESNAGYRFWKFGEGQDDHGRSLGKLEPPWPAQGFPWMLQDADVVTTPSKHLANKYAATYLPNMPTLKPWAKLARNKKKKLCVGWGGSGTHLESFRDSGVIVPLLRAAGEMNWDLRIVGAPNVMRLIQEASLHVRPKPHCIFKGYMPWDKWPSYLMRNLDLVVIPLAHEYDKARSPIKAIECGLAGVPWIATNNGVYDDFKPYGLFSENHSGQWYEKILYAMNNIGKLRQAALSARNFMMENVVIERNIDLILGAYE